MRYDHSGLFETCYNSRVAVLKLYKPLLQDMNLPGPLLLNPDKDTISLGGAPTVRFLWQALRQKDASFRYPSETPSCITMVVPDYLRHRWIIPLCELFPRAELLVFAEPDVPDRPTKSQLPHTIGLEEFKTRFALTVPVIEYRIAQRDPTFGVWAPPTICYGTIGQFKALKMQLDVEAEIERSNRMDWEITK